MNDAIILKIVLSVVRHSYTFVSKFTLISFLLLKNICSNPQVICMNTDWHEWMLYKINRDCERGTKVTLISYHYHINFHFVCYFPILILIFKHCLSIYDSCTKVFKILQYFYYILRQVSISLCFYGNTWYLNNHQNVFSNLFIYNANLLLNTFSHKKYFKWPF